MGFGLPKPIQLRVQLYSTYECGEHVESILFNSVELNKSKIGLVAAHLHDLHLRGTELKKNPMRLTS